MKTIVAIGGGSFQKEETRHIDEAIIRITGKKHPRVLFLPTASRDDQGYAKRFKQYYRSLGCVVESLRLFHSKMNKEAIREKLLSIDIVYIGGGNTLLLQQKLLEFKLQQVLLEAYEKGIVLCGYSAGANVLFDYGYSDMEDNGETFDLVEGFHLMDGIFCPHAQDEKRSDFNEKYFEQGYALYACKDSEAFIMEDGDIRLWKL